MASCGAPKACGRHPVTLLKHRPQLVRLADPMGGQRSPEQNRMTPASPFLVCQMWMLDQSTQLSHG